MRIFTLVLAVLSVAVLSANAQVRAQPARVADDPGVQSNLRLLEAWIETQIAYRNLPGMAIGIVYDQELVWARGFGYADVASKTPATPATIYRIASNSKVFTSVAVMQLRDAGKLRLEDPVADHLPWFRIRQRFPDARPITIRHLLTHTSGLPREAAYPYWTDLKFPTLEEVRSALPEQETVFRPETRWKYSNLALSLAGAVVAEVSGEPYADYMLRHIFEPLGMSSTSAVLPEAHHSRLATGYGRRMPGGQREVMPFTDARGITPAAGLSTTVEDAARFLSWQIRLRDKEGEEVLQSHTLREMHRVHWVHPSWQSGWGLGFEVVHREAGDLVGHGGWVAGYQTAIFLIPREKVGVVAFINADDGDPYPGSPYSVVDKAFAWVAPAIAEATAPPPPEADPGWERYVGTYREHWIDSAVLIHEGQLKLITPTELDPTVSMMTLIPMGEHTFRLEGPEGQGYGEVGEPVVFTVDSSGKAVRYRMGARTAERVE